MPPCRAEECGKRLLENGIVGDIRRDLPPLERRRIHECQLLGPGQTEKIRQPFQNPHVARRGIHPALDLAPVARIKPDPLAKIAQRQPLLQAQGFDGVCEHILFVVELYHARQVPATRVFISPHFFSFWGAYVPCRAVAGDSAGHCAMTFGKHLNYRLIFSGFPIRFFLEVNRQGLTPLLSAFPEHRLCIAEWAVPIRGADEVLRAEGHFGVGSARRFKTGSCLGSYSYSQSSSQRRIVWSRLPERIKRPSGEN